MAASRETVLQIMDVLRKHLTQEEIIAVINDLKREVEGNKSVLATIDALWSHIHGGY